MKRTVQVLPRNTYIGEKTHQHALALCDVLGQADSLIVEIFGHRVGTDARVQLECFASSQPAGRPREIGQRVKVIDPGTGQPADSVEFTVLRPSFISIPGPFAGRVELVVTIESVNPGTTPNPEFDLEVHATVIIGE